MIPKEHWENLRKLSKEEVCRNSLARFDEEKQGYILTVLGEEYLISPEKEFVKQISPPINDKLAKTGYTFWLSTVVYLTTAKDIPVKGELVTEKDLTGGILFFTGLHVFPFQKLLEKFGNKPEALIKAGEIFHGKKVKMGDVGIEFRVFPRVPVTYVLWQGDDEFPPEISLLFDRNIEKHMPLDAIWTMGDMASKRLIAYEG